MLSTFDQKKTFLGALTASLLLFSGLFFPADAQGARELYVNSYEYSTLNDYVLFNLTNNSAQTIVLDYILVNDPPTPGPSNPGLFYWGPSVSTTAECIDDGPYVELYAGATCDVQFQYMAVGWPGHDQEDINATKSVIDARLGEDALEDLYQYVYKHYDLTAPDGWYDLENSPAGPFPLEGGGAVQRSFEIDPTYPEPSATSTYQTGVQDDPGAVQLYGTYDWQPGEADCVLDYTDGTGAWYKTIDTWGWYAKALENDTEREFISYLRLSDWSCNGASGIIYDRFIYLPNGTYSLTYKLVQAHYSTSTQTYAYTYYEPDNGNATSTLIILGSRYAGGTTTTTVPEGPDPDTSIVRRWITDNTTNYFDTLSHRIPLNYIIPVIDSLDDFEYPTSSTALSLTNYFSGSSSSTSVDFSSIFDKNITIGQQTKTLREWAHLICRILVLVTLVFVFWKLFKWITAPSKTNV